MYDHDPEDVDVLGWDEFIARQWESIFAGYRTGSGLRRTGRRWSDLIQAGLGCPQEIADMLVRSQVIDRVDRDLEGTRNPDQHARLLAAVHAYVFGHESGVALPGAE